jgi:hypothetical protein
MGEFHSLGKTEYSQIDGELALIRLDSLRNELRSNRSVEAQIQVDLSFRKKYISSAISGSRMRGRTDLNSDVYDRFYEY